MRIIQQSRTLFLDRDGVINVRNMHGYIRNVSEFEFIDGVLEAMKIFASLFDTIVVVTNQQGIGKKIMSEDEFAEISKHMCEQISQNGGRIDAIYHCPHLTKDNSFDRKPSVGMGLKARKQFPQIRFKDSIMVGDSLSDLVFGKRLGMHTVHLSETNEEARNHPNRIDYRFTDLLEFAKYIKYEKDKTNK